MCLGLVATSSLPCAHCLIQNMFAAVEMFGRQLLARVALRIAEELQRPPRRFDQPDSMTGSGRPLYDGYERQI